MSIFDFSSFKRFYLDITQNEKETFLSKKCKEYWKNIDIS